MSEFKRAQMNAEEAAARRKTPEFQEAPGEAEAEAARDAFLQGAGAESTTDV